MVTASRNALIESEAEAALARSRADRLAHPERAALLDALSGDESVAEREGRVRARLLDRAAHSCRACGHVFVAGEVVHRARQSLDLGRSDSWEQRTRRYLVPVCSSCVAGWHSSWHVQQTPPVPCEGGCGVLVSSWEVRRWSGAPRIVHCSERCVVASRNARRRRAAPAARSCASCGGSFVPRRSDARYCSTACRVRAHRAASS